MSTEASSEKATEESKPEAAAAASNGNGNGDLKAELEALKKELEKKTEEAKDFKVTSPTITTSGITNWTRTDSIGNRINSPALSPTSVTSRTAPSVT
jgi:hypothetical protein